jgi:Flp pilus assembly protein TadG
VLTAIRSSHRGPTRQVGTSRVRLNLGLAHCSDRPNQVQPRPEGGAAAVEFALIATMLVSLVLGLVDTSFALDDANRTRQVVRESARLIATDAPDRVPASSTNTCGAVVGPMGNSERSRWAVCRVVARARTLRLDTTRLSVQVKTGQVSGTGLTVSPANGAQYTDAIVVCVAYRTMSRSGLLSGLYDNRYLRSRMVVPADGPTPLTASTVYQGTYGPTVDWTSCERASGTN